jgi:hypothetical protein
MNKEINSNKQTNTMSQLTYKELEILHYALRMFIEDSNNKDSFNSLHNKLIRMRAELEYPKQSTV